ncbi:hypothetical protein NDU88_002044 [Pleurodeles waltl]|uniref:Uncharacterized protein n=1 Tax=Pleurodeles waltl TaxID=8319 RepID=A0AAV7WQH0_PLEWA|nr:hypothetical protein NDU88_002044 [Pleurodeles waltl]
MSAQLSHCSIKKTGYLRNGVSWTLLLPPPGAWLLQASELLTPSSPLGVSRVGPNRSTSLLQVSRQGLQPCTAWGIQRPRSLCAVSVSHAALGVLYPSATISSPPLAFSAKKRWPGTWAPGGGRLLVSPFSAEKTSRVRLLVQPLRCGRRGGCALSFLVGGTATSQLCRYRRHVARQFNFIIKINYLALNSIRLTASKRVTVNFPRL